jgi:hypothetical protein
MKEHASLPPRSVRIAFAALFCMLLLACPQEAGAQSKFQIKRTKRETTPISVRLIGGFNGISDPSEPFQDRFENTVETLWGGLFAGLQGSILVDTIGRPFWAGLELAHMSVAKRRMAKKVGVYYRSDSSEVDKNETVSAYGIQALLTVDVMRRVSVQIGGGAQYMYSNADVVSDVAGLFETRWVPTMVGALSLTALEYEHGSIDFDFRAMQGFGDYGCFQFQSLICFTFNF